MPKPMIMAEYQDYLGNTVKVGDVVLFCEKGYRKFMTGAVIQVTEKTCLIAHTKVNFQSQTRQDHAQTILLEALA